MSTEHQGPRLEIDSDNRAALIVIVTAVGLSWTLLTLTIRIVSKLHVKRSIGLEEILVIVASIVAGLSSACVLVSVQHGLGRRESGINDEHNRAGLKLLWLSDIFYPLALGIAKIAALPLLAHLTRIRKFIITCYALAIFTALWTFLSVLMVAARCHLNDPWDDVSTKKCPSLYGRWIAIETVSVFIELLIFIVFVMIAFATRLPVVIPTAFRLIYLRTALPVATDTTFALTNAVIATQTVLHYTAMAASFAYLKPFLRAFDSNLGATVNVRALASDRYTHNSSDPTGCRSQEVETRPTSSYLMQPLKQDMMAQPDTCNHHTSIPPALSLEPQRSYHPSLYSDAPAIKPAAEPGRSSHEHTFNRKYNSRESMAPMITKTQEWHVGVETRH